MSERRRGIGKLWTWRNESLKPHTSLLSDMLDLSYSPSSLSLSLSLHFGSPVSALSGHGHAHGKPAHHRRLTQEKGDDTL